MFIIVAMFEKKQYKTDSTGSLVAKSRLCIHPAPDTILLVCVDPPGRHHTDFRESSHPILTGLHHQLVLRIR